MIIVAMEVIKNGLIRSLRNLQKLTQGRGPWSGYETI